MADYYEYHHRLAAERRRRRAWIALAVMIVLLCAAGIVYWVALRPKAVPAAAQQPAAAEPPADQQAGEPVSAPTAEQAAESAGPARLLPEISADVWDHSDPVAATVNTEYQNTDYRMVALPQLGTTATSYFDTVTFVGDSLTQGLELYDTGIKNAHYCAYKGAGPNSIVNGAELTDEIRGVTEVPLDALAASAPDYVYLLFGTNSLVSQGNEDSFLAYYDKMIDLMRERLDPGVIFYIQAIPGVQETVAQTKPGLDNARIRQVDNMLANLALRKGCYFVNLQEALTYADGSQIDEFQVNDGIHMQPSGYAAWSDYLARHTAWNRRTLYQGENPYYILGT